MAGVKGGAMGWFVLATLVSIVVLVVITAAANRRERAAGASPAPALDSRTPRVAVPFHEPCGDDGVGSIQRDGSLVCELRRRWKGDIPEDTWGCGLRMVRCGHGQWICPACGAHVKISRVSTWVG